MAEKPGGGNPLFSMFGGHKRIPRESFYGYLFTGATVDAVGWFFGIPGLGDLYILGCRGLLYLNGNETRGMAAITWATALAEAVPPFSYLPAATLFAAVTYSINVAETSKVGAAVINIKSRGTSGTGETGPAAPGMPGPTGPRTFQQRGAPGAGGNPEDTGREEGGQREDNRPPTTFSDRDTPNRQKNPRERSERQPYENDARGTGIDGMRRPGGSPQTFRPGGAEMPEQPFRMPEIGDEPGDTGYANGNAPRGIDGIRDYRGL